MTDAVQSRAYARALFGAARATGTVDAMRTDLANVLGAIADSPELRRWIARRPPAAPPRRVADARRFFSGRASSPALRCLLEQMAVWNHLYLIPDVARRFEAAAREMEGRYGVQVLSAAPIEGPAEATLRHRLSAAVPSGSIEIDLRSDPRLLAGLTVRIEDRLIDASLAGRLARLRQSLANPGRSAATTAPA